MFTLRGCILIIIFVLLLLYLLLLPRPFINESVERMVNQLVLRLDRYKGDPLH
jgi:hypothetical protein